MTFNLDNFIKGKLAYNENGSVVRCVDCDSRRNPKHLLVCVDVDTGFVTFNDADGVCWRKKNEQWFQIPKFNLVDML